MRLRVESLLPPPAFPQSEAAGSTKNAVRYESAINQQLQIGFFDIGDLHLGLKKTDLQRFVSVDRDDDSFSNTVLEENIVATLDSGQ